MSPHDNPRPIHAVARTWLVLLLAALGVVTARADLAPGDPFPSLAAAELAGDALPATAGRGTLVDFWASWCAPCKASFSAYARLHADYAARGLVIVAVSVDDKPWNFDGFRRRAQPPFATVLDRHQQLVRAVMAPAMPTAYLLGRDGRVRYVHVGFHGSTTEQELRTQIEALLAEKS